MSNMEPIDYNYVEELKNFISTFKDMLKKKEFTDVTLICKQSEIEAHRIVLSAQSPYFRRMFSSDFKESTAPEINFSHIDSELMQMIIDYMYSNLLTCISVTELDEIIQVFQISHLFEMNSIVNYCWNLIMDQINTDNWFTIWELVRLHGTRIHYCKILNFILTNFDDISEQEAFVNLSQSDISIIIEEMKENEFIVTDNFLEAVIEYMKIHKLRMDDIRELLMNINYDCISREYVDRIIETETHFLEDKSVNLFFRQHLSPKLKPISEIPSLFKWLSPEVESWEIDNFNFFVFDRQKKLMNRYTFQCNVNLKIFNYRTKLIRHIDCLPFIYDDALFPIKNGSDIYIIGAIPTRNLQQQIDSFLCSFIRYNWQTNIVTRLASLPAEVGQNPLLSVIGGCIYFIHKEPHANTSTIYYFSIHDQKWCKIKKSVENVIGLVNIKNVLYLISSKYQICSLYTSRGVFHCILPVNVNECSITDKISAFKDEIYILADNNCAWHVFNPTTKAYKKIVFANEYPSSNYKCFNVNDRSLMLYNKGNQKLFRYSQGQSILVEVMTFQTNRESKLLISE